MDINKAGWESSEFPSVCEKCLGPNPYLRMMKENYGAECKICTRPFTVFKWVPDNASRSKKTVICMSCSRLKNACQHCLLDLQFGLPLQIRDAALKLATQGANSGINREYFVQNNKDKYKDGETAVEFGTTDAAARDLLQRLSQTDAYYKRDRPFPCTMFAQGGCPRGDECPYSHNLEDFPQSMRRIGADNGEGDADQHDSHGGDRKRARTDASDDIVDRGTRTIGRSGAIVPVTSGTIDLTPPKDPKIMSLFLTGVEDDLPEHLIRSFFEPYGKIRSVVCVHQARSAFVNFANRQAAEAAVEGCNGPDIVIGSCPLRVQWGKPKALGPNAEEQARAVVQSKKAMAANASARAIADRKASGRAAYAKDQQRLPLSGGAESYAMAAPPSAQNAKVYPSQLRD